MLCALERLLVKGRNKVLMSSGLLGGVVWSPGDTNEVSVFLLKKDWVISVENIIICSTRGLLRVDLIGAVLR